jgi:hypothetical protein
VRTLGNWTFEDDWALNYSMNEPFKTLISAAMLAPSGDNMQPWRFEIDERGASLTICVDEARDPSPMNAGQRMSRVACGAAIENIVQTARYNKWEVFIETHEDPFIVATFGIKTRSSQVGQIPDAIKHRHTNRRLYDRQVLPDSFGSQWQVAFETENDVAVSWVTKPDVIRNIANAVGQADAAMFGRPAFFKAFLSNVRFDLPFDAPAEEGLCTGALELLALERRVLPLLSRAPNAILRSALMRRSFQVKAERLVKSASGLCLIDRRNTELGTDVQIGRLMERCWLHLTEAGYHVQPMMSIPVLVNADAAGTGSKDSISRLLGDSAVRAFESITERLPAAILRFGHGPAATARTGRRRIDQVIDSRVPHSPADDLISQ